MFCVVETKDEDGYPEVFIASTKWIRGSVIACPSIQKLQHYLHKHTDPLDNWPLYKFKMLSHNIGK